MLTAGLLQLGFAAAIALALAARLGALLQYLFPIAAILTAVLIERRSLPGYLSFVIWLWMLTPLVRRVADLQSGWHEPSLILLAPYGASAYPAAREAMVAVVRSIRVWPRLEGLGLFVMAGIGAGIGIPLGLLMAPPTAIVETLNWWVPIGLGAYIAINATDPDAVERAVARTLLYAGLVLGAYALYQFEFAPVWDTEWMNNVAMGSIGNAREFEVRVFSTSHSPGVLGFAMLPAIILWVARPRLRDFAAMAGAVLALALSQSRAGWIALVVAALLVLRRVGARERRAVLACVLVAGVCIAPFLVPAEVSDVTLSRFMTLLTPSEDNSAMQRVWGHIAMLDVIREHPLGLGMGVDDATLAQWIGPRDSMVVTTFVQFGIIGATIYLLATVVLLLRFFVYYREAVTGEALALACLGIGALCVALLGTYTAGPIGIYVWMSAGLATVRVRARRLAAADAHARSRPAPVVALRPAVSAGGLEQAATRGTT